MKTRLRTLSLFIFITLFMFSADALATTKQKIYDFAELLTAEEVEQLESLATAYSDETEVEIIILTTYETDGRDVKDYMGDFYDQEGLGYNKQHGDTVILTLDMGQRDVYVAGFYKGELYIDNSRAELIREEITPYLSDGYFFEAFTEFIELTRYYLGIEPFDPEEDYGEPNQDQYYIDTREHNYRSQEENIFFELWFQLLVSAGVAGIAVGVMGYRSSGRKTTNARTYLDQGRSAVTARNDTFIRKTVTKVKKPTSNKGGGGGIGGGGFTGGGHSHSGSKGKF
jgi:uncharacterized protein